MDHTHKIFFESVGKGAGIDGPNDRGLMIIGYNITGGRGKFEGAYGLINFIGEGRVGEVGLFLF